MNALPAQYDTAAIEKKWQQHWLAAKTYAWNSSTARADSYVIDTPPPTVSGTLHMGHVYSYTQADFIARFQRMTGKNVFYPMGFDDNGLPTERLVEKTKKIRATDMSREAFIAECLQVSEEARAEFRALFQSIALSVDWDQEYHTISDDSRRLSQLSFLDLVNKGEVYRKLQPMLWDPVDQTAIAQAEVVDKELPSNACDIIFMCEGTPLTIMTTRPELLPACVALFCHPEDSRYTHLHGKNAEVPLFGFPVPVLTDVAVDPEKGTGLMMCCTFGDEADIEKWRKHQLPTRMVLNKFGKIDLNLALAEGKFPDGFHWPSQLSEALDGKKVSNTDPKHLGARETVIALLKEAGLLVKQTPITHAVKTAERSGAPLEIIPTHQWFVKVTDKKDALKAKAAECNWNPDWMRIRIEQWIDGLNWDWCISRQRFFGVPFPVWYECESVEDAAKNNYKIIHPSETQLPVNPLVDLPDGYRKTDPTTNPYPIDPSLADSYITCVRPDGETVLLRGDPDVMDTWATSSISPQLSAGAISPSVIPAQAGIHLESGADGKMDSSLRRNDEKKERFSKLFPADLRPQAHEIIRTWAFYTIVKAHLHNHSIPWKNLMISGWCLAEDKSKMSKSKGNVVTPVALIEEKGTDAVRYWAGTSRLGQDTAFSPDLLKIGKKLVGKLWNATQFAAIHLSKLATAPTTAATDAGITEILDKGILSCLHQTIAKATDSFAAYEYADALDATNQFFWADFCDNYLELIKKRVYNEDGSASATAQQSAVRTLYYVLNGILKLYAPFVPHVTEELYSHIFAADYDTKKSLHAMGQWPKADDYPLDENALHGWRYTKEAMERIRRTKSEANKSVKWPISLAQFPKSAIFLHEVFEQSEYSLASLAYDLKGAGNITVLELGAGMVSITLATEADAA